MENEAKFKNMHFRNTPGSSEQSLSSLFLVLCVILQYLVNSILLDEQGGRYP